MSKHLYIVKFRGKIALQEVFIIKYLNALYGNRLIVIVIFFVIFNLLLCEVTCRKDVENMKSIQLPYPCNFFSTWNCRLSTSNQCRYLMLNFDVESTFIFDRWGCDQISTVNRLTSKRRHVPAGGHKSNVKNFSPPPKTLIHRN